MLIRAARATDLPAIRSLLVETWHATYDPIYGAAHVTRITDDWHSLRSLQSRLERPDSAFLVAEHESEIAGIAFAAPNGTGDLVLYQLYVLPAFQRGGIGSRLLAEVEARFASERAIILEVEPANHAARTFYERKGFALAAGTDETGEGSRTLKYQRRIGSE